MSVKRKRAMVWSATGTAIAACAVAGSVAVAQPGHGTGQPPPHAAAVVNATPAPSTAPGRADPVFGLVGRYDTGYDFSIPENTGRSAAETFAISGGRMYVTNFVDSTLDVVDVRKVASPQRLDRIALGLPPNSVAASGDLVAVALEAPEKTDPGTIRFYRRAGDSLRFLVDVTVGAQPDMVVFTRNGKELLVANEGEPSDDGYGPGLADPEGSVSIIDTSKLLRGAPKAKGKKAGTAPAVPPVRTVDFRAFNEGGPRHAELPGDIRLNGPGATVAEDLEPEYIDISPNGRVAYVSLQENNALALIDIKRARVIRIISLGHRDHSAPGHAIDASDRDGAINIRNWPVMGIPMPDGLAAFKVGGRDYVITANEGDAREWLGDDEDNPTPTAFSDVGRLRGSTAQGTNLQIPGYTEFTGAELAENQRLGRLNISLTDGWENGVLRQPYSFGSRSVSILRPDGTLVWDSGDAFERRTAAERPDIFNASNSNNTFDNRSDDKGPEPEDVAVGKINGRTYAFVALERVGGMMVLDISNPADGRITQWANTRDYGVPLPYTDTNKSDSGPEIVKFLAPKDSPTRRPLVVLSHEVSGTITFHAPIG